MFTEQFTSELEGFTSHLVMENQNLVHENKQLNILLKDYENVLESVMIKFRSVSVSSRRFYEWTGVCNDLCPAFPQHAATKHELSLHHYYTTLLHNLRTAQSSEKLLDSTTLSTLLQRLSTLIRLALRSVNGEDDMGRSEEWETLAQAVDMVDSLRLGDSITARHEIDEEDKNDKTSVSGLSIATDSTLTNMTTIAIGSTVIPKPHNSVADSQTEAGKDKAMTRTLDRSEWALEREEELIRLAAENKLLREMLEIDRTYYPETSSSKSNDATETQEPNPPADEADDKEIDMVDVDLGNGSKSSKPSGLERSVSDTSPSNQSVTAQLDMHSAIDKSSSVSMSPPQQQREPSTSPKHSLTRSIIKSPRLAKHPTYNNIPTTATTPLSPSAIRDGVTQGRDAPADGVGEEQIAPKLTTSVSTPAIPSTGLVSGSSASPSTLSSLLRPGSRTKTGPTTATSAGVDFDDDDGKPNGRQSLPKRSEGSTDNDQSAAIKDPQTLEDSPSRSRPGSTRSNQAEKSDEPLNLAATHGTTTGRPSAGDDSSQTAPLSANLNDESAVLDDDEDDDQEGSGKVGGRDQTTVGQTA